MKKGAKQSIITLDVYSNKNYKFANGVFEIVKKLKTNKQDVIISYVTNSDLIIEPIDLSSHVPEEEVQNAIVDKVYDELMLDVAVEYDIYPVKIGSDGSLDKYQTIIVDKSKLNERFAPILKKTKVIDYVVPAPFLYQSLYSINKLKKGNIDMFIYFGDKDTFITFYKNTKYIYSKSLKFSLKDMYERVCQLAQEVFLTEDEFKNKLKSGAYKSDDKLNDLMIKILNECFLNINDILVYAKRVYSLDKIDNTFIGFSWGYVDGIENYVKNYLNLDSKPISSIYSKENPSKLIDPLCALEIYSVKEMSSGAINIPNLTPAPRPLPLSKRPAGKILGIATFVILAALALPIYDYAIGLITKVNNSVLATQEREVRAQADKYRNIIKQKTDKLKALNVAKQKLEHIYTNKKGKLEEVYNRKFMYNLKSEQLAEITKLLTKYPIVSRGISITDTKYAIEVESKDDKKITAFVKELVKKFNRKIQQIDMTNLKFDEKDKLYKGIVSVEFLKDVR